MKKKAVAYVIASLILSFILLEKYPLNGSISAKNFLFLIATLAIEGAFLLVYSITNLPSYLLAINLALILISKQAIALCIWLIYGVNRARATQKNLIKPNLKAASNALFSLPFLIMIITSTALVYPSLSFSIPKSVTSFAVDIGLKTYGKSLPCNPEMNINQCIDEIYSKNVQNQCKNQPACIALLKSQESSIKEEIKKELINQFPEFEKSPSLKEAIRKEVESGIEGILANYEPALKALSALLLIFALQFIGKIAEPIAYLLALIAIEILKRTGALKEKTVKVDKVIYEV